MLKGGSQALCRVAPTFSWLVCSNAACNMNCSHQQPDGGSSWELWPPVLRSAFGNETSALALRMYLFQSFWCTFNAALCFVMLSSASVQHCGGVSRPCTLQVEPSLTLGMCHPGWLEGPQFLFCAQMLSWVPWHALPLLWISCLFYTIAKTLKYSLISSRSGSSKLSKYHQIESEK